MSFCVNHFRLCHVLNVHNRPLFNMFDIIHIPTLVNRIARNSRLNFEIRKKHFFHIVLINIS